MQPSLDEDTDRHAAIRLQHLSPTWVRFLDHLAGEMKQRNGGYFGLEIHFEKMLIDKVTFLRPFFPRHVRQWQQHPHIDQL